MSALVQSFLPGGDTVNFVVADVVARGHVVGFVGQPYAGTGYICTEHTERLYLRVAHTGHIYTQTRYICLQ